RTGRHLDSYSAFADVPGCFSYTASAFVDQACLISLAKSCVFFTEGDFGSHIYVPPLLGKNVHAIAPRDIYQLGTTPIDYWNRTVFGFGGQILPWEAEEVFRSTRSIAEVADEILGHHLPVRQERSHANSCYQ